MRRLQKDVFVYLVKSSLNSAIPSSVVFLTFYHFIISLSFLLR